LGFPLAHFAEEMRDAGQVLDPFGGDDAATDVRAVFSWSYHALSTDAARLFRLLGLHPGPDITVGTAASLAGIAPGRVRPLLAELTRGHLLTEHRPGRYTFHDLLRAYAAEQARIHDHDGARSAAVGRLLDHCLHTAHAAATLIDPYFAPVAAPAPSQPRVVIRASPRRGGPGWLPGRAPPVAGRGSAGRRIRPRRARLAARVARERLLARAGALARPGTGLPHGARRRPPRRRHGRRSQRAGSAG